MTIQEINKKKFEIFLEVARSLNEKFDFAPILFGSLGLFRLLGHDGKVNDIDILVPGQFIKENWNELIPFMEKLGFVLADEHEHEFGRDGEFVAFGKMGDLMKKLNFDLEEIKITKIGDVKFRELTAEQYLCVYKFFLKDNYRQEVKNKRDQEKIDLIENFLGSEKN